MDPPSLPTFGQERVPVGAGQSETGRQSPNKSVGGSDGTEDLIHQLRRTTEPGVGHGSSEQLNSNGWPPADSNCRLRLINSIGGAGNNHCCITADGRHCLTAGYANQLLSALPIRADGGFQCDGETAALPPDSVVLSSLPAGRSCGTLRCVCLPLHWRCQLFALS